MIEKTKDCEKAFFYERQAFLLQTNTIQSVMPMFKSFILTFEQKIPMVHQLHDKMLETLKFFLSSFLKMEHLKDSKLTTIDVNDKKHQLPTKCISCFTGNAAQQVLSLMQPNDKDLFLNQLLEAYIACGKYLQEKLPISNIVLKALSSLDPIVHGHSAAQKEMEKLLLSFPTVV